MEAINIVCFSIPNLGYSFLRHNSKLSTLQKAVNTKQLSQNFHKEKSPKFVLMRAEQARARPTSQTPPFNQTHIPVSL
jgi:hypothetical protein